MDKGMLKNKVITYSFGEDFIKNIAGFLQEHCDDGTHDMSRTCCVFGGKRPSLFVKKQLALNVKGCLFPPVFFSVDEFIEYIVSKNRLCGRMPDMDAYFLLYELSKTICPSILKNSGFSKFLPWAREIYHFIEQLDLEDISTDPLKNIQKNAQIGYDVPDNINSLLQSILSLRETYHKTLAERKQYSRGFMYLTAAQTIETANFDEFDRILFCNFFHLHKTEQTIIKHLYQKENTWLFFQGSEDNWPALREIAKNFNCRIKPEKAGPPAPGFSLYAGFDAHSQICTAREIIKKTSPQESTVIVLPKAENLTALLPEIASCTEQLNVSLGYPVKRSPLYSLFESIFRAQKTKNEHGYYAKDYLRVLSHPFVKNANILREPAVTRILIHKTEELLTGKSKSSLSGSLFVPLAEIENNNELYAAAADTISSTELEAGRLELETIVKEIHLYLFKIWENTSTFKTFSSALQQFLDFLLKKNSFQGYSWNLTIAECLFEKEEQLKTADFKDENFEQQDIFKIFMNLLDNEMISFIGSPLKGVQVLGLLETRALNFQNVIVLDVNESVLPKLQIYEPLIPREIMVGLGLSRIEREEEIQRYQFMRLISSARKVHLIYDENPRLQRSRFIETLVWEKEQQEKKIDTVKPTHVSFPIKVLHRKKIMPKKDEVIRFFQDFTFSASSIDTYVHCPLRFYYRYVLRLKEKENILEDIEAREIGNFVHRLLEKTFGSFVSRKLVIDEQFRAHFFDVFDRDFAEYFEHRMKSDSFLVKQVMQFRLEKFLNSEQNRNVEQILGVEEIIEDTLNTGLSACKITARIDRIDLTADETLLVLDYKTGSSADKPAIRNVENIGQDRANIKKTVKSFQLPLYSYLIQKKYPGKTVNSAFYFLSTAQIEPLLKEPKNQQHVIDRCIEAIQIVLSEILNPKIDFAADEENPHYCQTCPFSSICK